MRRSLKPLIVGVLMLGGGRVAAEEARASDSGQHPQYVSDREHTTAARDWGYSFRPVGLLTQQRGLTGFAFGSGRSEVAFCAPRGGASALWTVPAALGKPDLPHPYVNPAQPRLVWTAPAGVTLRGPVWWAPNGSVIAVLACEGNKRDLVAVDYANGEATFVTRDASVAEAAWAPGSEQLAYVTELGGKRLLWLQSFPPAAARPLGKDGLHLRWARDGSALRWLERTSESEWTEWEWCARDGQIVNCGTKPRRDEGARWSPDGKWCATLERGGESGARGVTICPASSEKGETVRLPGVSLAGLLGWSPDSNLVLAQDDHGYPWAISAAPPQAEELLIYKGHAVKLSGLSRGQFLAWPTKQEAGDPSWSSGGEQLTYVVSEAGVPGHVWGLVGIKTCEDRLALISSEREYLKPEPEDRRTIEKACVMSNVKDIAMALVMYTGQWNDLPSVAQSEDLRRLLSPYVSSQDVFLKPYGTDAVALQWLLKPGETLSSLRERKSSPTGVPAIAVDLEYWPGYCVVGSSSGSAQLYPRAALEAKLREEEGQR